MVESGVRIPNQGRCVVNATESFGQADQIDRFLSVQFQWRHDIEGGTRGKEGAYYRSTIGDQIQMNDDERRLCQNKRKKEEKRKEEEK